MQCPLPFDVHAIHRQLTTRRLGRRIELHDRLDSTNREAVALAQAGADHGTVVLADAQSAGRGRMGRVWFSPPGLHIYASVIIRIPVDAAAMPAWLSWLPLLAAVGAADAIEAVGSARVAVKWPNDLLIRDRKVGGILCESATAHGTGSFQVVGIGVNVNGAGTHFPESLRQTATTVEEEGGRVVDRNALLSELLCRIESYLDGFVARGATAIAPAYRLRCATIGRTVKAVLADGRECIGLAEGVEDDGSLTFTEHAPALVPARQLRAADIIHLR